MRILLWCVGLLLLCTFNGWVVTRFLPPWAAIMWALVSGWTYGKYFPLLPRRTQTVKFLSTCRGYGYWHLHVGGYPNWFQIRIRYGRGAKWPYLIICREDIR